MIEDSVSGMSIVKNCVQIMWQDTNILKNCWGKLSTAKPTVHISIFCWPILFSKFIVSTFKTQIHRHKTLINITNTKSSRGKRFDERENSDLVMLFFQKSKSRISETIRVIICIKIIRVRQRGAHFTPRFSTNND